MPTDREQTVKSCEFFYDGEEFRNMEGQTIEEWARASGEQFPSLKIVPFPEVDWSDVED